MGSENGWSRRVFLQTITAAVPTLELMLPETSAWPAPVAGPVSESAGSKFTPADLRPHFNASPSDFGPRERARELSEEGERDGLIRIPTGQQSLRGIPFWLGPEGIQEKSWVVLSTHPNAWAASRVEIPLRQKASFICLAQFCDWDEYEESDWIPSQGPKGIDLFEKIGQLLADAVLVYEDGSERTFPIRRRFEVNSPSIYGGHLCSGAAAHRKHIQRKLTDPTKNLGDWFWLQTGCWLGDGYPLAPNLKTRAMLWVCALENPTPDRTLQALRLLAKTDDALVVCGLTVFRGRENPLRYGRLRLYRINLPEDPDEGEGRWEVGVDLGIVTRSYFLPEFDSEAWLSEPARIKVTKQVARKSTQHLYVEMTASNEATVWLRDNKTSKQYEFDLGRLVPGRELEAHVRGPRIEIVEPDKIWLHGRVVDAATQHPTPVRLAFRTHDGRYLPPYGHRTEINTGFFQDYGADLKKGDNSFAYVDGTFQIELPVGEVYVEISKGFEYEVVRKKLKLEPGHRKLDLEIPRRMDLRAQGWITADTHVHVLSPSTAVLEGQAEGLNLVNLLAIQFGDYFVNVGDLAHGPLTSRDGETVVWIGTENRQHFLGHIGVLGGHGEPAYPFSASGPSESSIGDPLWSTLSEWADACRQREGLAIAVHFPVPKGEWAADIVLDKIDALELYPYDESFYTDSFLEWYRYLNCGYRLPVVGGTDKMGAFTPVGENRTYAYLGQDEFSFANWAKAVRRGNTFMTTGPLLSFLAEGHPPGSEIMLRPGGGTVEVVAEAKSVVPFHRLEIVLNGHVVAMKEELKGTRELILREKVQVSGPSWLAARCASPRHAGSPMSALWVAAHTSPVYLAIPGQKLFSPRVASYLLTQMDHAETWVKTLAILPDTEKLDRALRVFRDARERLHRRMHQHGIKH